MEFVELQRLARLSTKHRPRLDTSAAQPPIPVPFANSRRPLDWVQPETIRINLAPWVTSANVDLSDPLGTNKLSSRSPSVPQTESIVT